MHKQTQLLCQTSSNRFEPGVIFAHLICPKSDNGQDVIKRYLIEKTMAWLILFCSIVFGWLDYRVLRVAAAGDSARFKRCISIAWLTDFLPQISTVACFIFFRNNPTWLIKTNCWIFFAYLILAVARAPFNLVYIISKSRLLLGMGIGTGAIMIFALIYGTVVTRTDYVVNKIIIESEKIPESFSGYKIIELSDLHIGTMLNPERQIAKIAEICNGLNPDMIAMCGDLTNIRHEEITPSIALCLSKLKAHNGVYSITGNHDVGVYIMDSLKFTPDNNTRQIIAKQRKLGWRVLYNQTDYIHRAGDSITITGISYDKTLQDHRHSRKLPDTDLSTAYKDVNKGLFNITLVHIPQLWDRIITNGHADLTLTGHVHSMQIKIPIGKRGISPAMIKYKRWSGLYNEQGRHLYINDGIGCVGFPARIGAKPEITLFELRHK